LAEKLYSDSSLVGSYNFGPQPHEAASVKRVIELANQVYGPNAILWGDGSQGPHEAGLLSLEIVKAKEILGVSPRWNLEETVARTMQWYLQFREGAGAHLLCEADIAEFTCSEKV
jgi:CDP-glucose 4,6-dehydratase